MGNSQNFNNHCYYAQVLGGCHGIAVARMFLDWFLAFAMQLLWCSVISCVNCFLPVDLICSLILVLFSQLHKNVDHLNLENKTDYHWLTA